MMNAVQARQLVKVALSVDNEKVKIVLDCWHRAIEKAAKAGRTSVREGDVDRVRTPIPASAKIAAFEQLIRDGFTVETVSEGPNQFTVQVSWM